MRKKMSQPPEDAQSKEWHRSAYLKAAAAVADIADEEDRRIVSATFSQVPAP